MQGGVNNAMRYEAESVGRATLASLDGIHFQCVIM